MEMRDASVLGLPNNRIVCYAACIDITVSFQMERMLLLPLNKPQSYKFLKFNQMLRNIGAHDMQHENSAIGHPWFTKGRTNSNAADIKALQGTNQPTEAERGPDSTSCSAQAEKDDRSH